MLSTPEEERAYWDAQASSEEAAKGAIAADESAWTGEQLKQSLALIEPALRLRLAKWRGDALVPTIVTKFEPWGTLKPTMPMVLDLGCGIGRLLLPLAKKYPDIWFVGLDVSPRLVELGRKRAIADNLDNASFLAGNGRDLGGLVAPPPAMPQVKLYGAYSMIAMQHMPREAQAGYIRQIGERLVQDGAFRFQVREGVSETFLNHYVTEEWIYDTCRAAGLRVEAYDRLGAFSDPSIICPWVTARKP